MVDLRTVSMTDRRALCAEAERRARRGEAPEAIRAALGVGRGTYARWAKRCGFRQADLYPDRHLAGAPVTLAAGPGGYARSGRFYAGEGLPRDHPSCNSGAAHPGWTGGEVASRARYGELRDGQRNAAAAKVETLSEAVLLAAIKAAMAEGEISEADRLLRAWRGQQRRAAGLAALEAAAAVKAASVGALPEDWQPGEAVTRAQIAAMDDYTLYRHICAKAGETPVAREDFCGGKRPGEQEPELWEIR